MLEGLLPLSGYLRFFATLAAVLDPFLAVPIFLALTAQRGAAERGRLVNVVSITVFAVLAGSALFGEQLLLLVGASLPAFRVGGGLVLLLMALAMLNAQVGGVRQSQEEARELQSGELSGVVPLAVPLLAGPGAVMDAPASVPLLPAYQAGHLAFVHATGLSDPSRSHFDMQRWMELGVTGATSGGVFTGYAHMSQRMVAEGDFVAQGDLVGVEHRAEDVAHFLELGLGVVERDHRRAAPPGLERVAAAAAPHVEDPRAWADAEAIEVGREHQAPRRACSRSSSRAR